jgi:predicted SprT family Zn-dependent metalloprotease
MSEMLERVETLMRALAFRCFHGKLRQPRIALSRKLRSSAGMADYRTWTIRLSIPYHDLYGWEREAEDTLLHEMIHLWLRQRGRPSGHTPEFKALASAMGCPRYAKRMPARRRIGYRCAHCGAVVVYRRRVTLACRPCCDRLNGGRFSRRFLLVQALSPAQSCPAAAGP